MLETVFKVCHIRVLAYWAVLNRSTLDWGQIAAKISFVANQKSSIFHVWAPRNQLVLSDRVISAQIHFHCDQDGKMNLCPPLKHFVAIFTHFYIYLMLSQRKRQWFMNDFIRSMHSSHVGVWKNTSGLLFGCCCQTHLQRKTSRSTLQYVCYILVGIVLPGGKNKVNSSGWDFLVE